MMKRMLAFAMAVMIAFAALPALAEELGDDLDDEELTADQAAAVEALDAVDAEAEPIVVVGAVYQEATLADFSRNSPAIYTAKVESKYSMFAERSTKSKRLFYSKNSGYSIDVLYVGSAWVIGRAPDGTIAYILRDYIYDVTPVDPTTTPRYGTQKSAYIATTATTCHVRKSMSDQDACWVVLNPGTLLSIWQLCDGWAIVPYWRTYGYINLNELTDLIPVSPTDTPISPDSPIAAYTSYYNMSQDETNLSRLVNIEVACDYLCRTMQPGETLNFNKQIGPYRKSRGYQPAWVLINGTSVKGYGGGTCQVSSTLFNAVIQLPGITVLHRRPHGPAGAKYLPHGVDAAVGNENLNLIFRNDYPFPIRVEGHTSNDGALLMVIWRADTMLPE